MTQQRDGAKHSNPASPEGKPVLPGQILFEEFMEPLELSQNGLARAIGVPPRRINEIVHGKRAITADTALRLAAYLGPDPQFWLNLQTHYDLSVAYLNTREVLEAIEPYDSDLHVVGWLNPMQEGE
ncbi:MAG: HigA family addiction module antidote protein [Corynebacterium sp.]|nr:HigA family addiction module antidote protein [Corynebacterium sp.]